MDPKEPFVRVWRGADWLLARFLCEVLSANGLGSYLDRDTPALQLEPGMSEVGLWVEAREETRARDLIAEIETQGALGDDAACEAER